MAGTMQKEASPDSEQSINVQQPLQQSEEYHVQQQQLQQQQLQQQHSEIGIWWKVNTLAF